MHCLFILNNVCIFGYFPTLHVVPVSLNTPNGTGIHTRSHWFDLDRVPSFTGASFTFKPSKSK